MKNHKLRLILIALVMLGFIWIAWPEAKPSGSAHNPNAESSDNSGRGDRHLLNSGENNNLSRSKSRTGSREEAGMKRIDRLITHQTLSNEEVADQLFAIAQDKSMSEKVRAEALGHGAILNLPSFADMSADTQLPVEMAETFLQHVINENRNPALQIRTYVNFLSHSSPEIREEVKGLLAFMLEDDAGEKDVPSLLKMADVKLKELEAEKLAEK